MEVSEYRKEWAQSTKWSCTCACMAVFLERIGRPDTQQDLINTCAAQGCGEFADRGGVDAGPNNLSNIQALADQHGFQVELVTGAGIPEVGENEAYLVLTSKDLKSGEEAHHCMLYVGNHTDGKRLIMNPNGETQETDQEGNLQNIPVGFMATWDDEEIMATECYFVKIRPA